MSNTLLEGKNAANIKAKEYDSNVRSGGGSSAVGLVTAAGAASPSIVNTASSGLAMVSRTWAVSTVDYNNDGLEDIWLGFHANAGVKTHAQ